MISVTWALGAVVGNLAYTLRPLFVPLFAFVAVLGIIPGSRMFQGYLLVTIAAVPISIFGILPNAIIADIADATKTGNHKAAVFFGSRGLVMKLGIAAANLIVPSLLLGYREDRIVAIIEKDGTQD